MLRIKKITGRTVKSKMEYVQFNVEGSTIAYVAQINPKGIWFVYTVGGTNVLTAKDFRSNGTTSKKNAIKHAYGLAAKYAKNFEDDPHKYD
jgi:hypothetical protein